MDTLNRDVRRVLEPERTKIGCTKKIAFMSSKASEQLPMQTGCTWTKDILLRRCVVFQNRDAHVVVVYKYAYVLCMKSLKILYG